MQPCIYLNKVPFNSFLENIIWYYMHVTLAQVYITTINSLNRGSFKVSRNVLFSVPKVLH